MAETTVVGHSHRQKWYCYHTRPSSGRCDRHSYDRGSSLKQIRLGVKMSEHSPKSIEGIVFGEQDRRGTAGEDALVARILVGGESQTINNITAIVKDVPCRNS